MPWHTDAYSHGSDPQWPSTSPAEQTRRDRGVGDDDRRLVETLLTLVRSGPPARRAPEPPRAVDRAWHPSPDADCATADGVFTARHPAFTFSSIDCPFRSLGRSPRSMFRGRQGRFHSRKMGRTLRAQSDLEFDLFLLCELDPETDAFVEQPATLRYRLAGRSRTHTPDLFILRRTAGAFIEVKWEAEAALPDNEQRWPVIGAALAALGYGYQVLTERHIRRQPRFANLCALFADRHACLPDEAVRRQMAAALPQTPTVAIRDLLTWFPQLASKQVHALIVRGYFATDLDVPLGPDSPLRFGPAFPGSPHAR